MLNNVEIFIPAREGNIRLGGEFYLLKNIIKYWVIC
jgi:hypothetical protein